MTRHSATRSEIYEPEIRAGEDLCGIAMNTARRGDQVQVLQRAFVTSYNHRDHHVFDETLLNTMGQEAHRINDAIVVMRGRSFHIYRSLPDGLQGSMYDRG